MTKIIVIPDIHCMFEEAEEIISNVKPDQTIFTGDYFDRFDSDPMSTGKVADWLKHSVEEKNRIHLLGNHELFYVSGNDMMKCSGNTQTNLQTIKMRKIPWNKFNLCYWIDESWLVTHAGLSNRYYMKYGKDTPLRNFMKQESGDAMKNLLDGKYHRLFSASFMRGGNSDVAGSLWCDLIEFEPIPGIQQIFGHTHRSWMPVKVDEQNYCIDCDGCYAVYEDGKMELKCA